MKFLITIIFLSLPVSIMAGGMDSGGGQGFVCFNSEETNKLVRDNNGNIADNQISEISQVVTLDYFEAKLKRGNPAMSPKLIQRNENENYEQFLNRIIERVDHFYPLLGHKLIEMQQNFSGDHLIWSAIGLTKVSDSGSVLAYDSKLCTITTLAIQFKEENSYYLNIDPRLFESLMMSEESKATLFLHEYLYAIARDNGKTSSRGTRLAISYLLREDINTKEIEDNLRLLNFIN